MKHYLITGGAGFIGSSLTKSLIKQGHRIRVLDNESRGTVERLKDIEGNFEFIKGDIRDKEIVEKACHQIDCVIHLAYINGTEYFYTKPELILEVGVKGIINILDGAVKHKVKDFILLSSSEVYQTPTVIPTPETVAMVIPDPFNPRYSYGAGKIISEILTINYGRKFFNRVMIVRPHNVYGPNMGFEHVIPQLTLRIKKMMENNSNEIIKLPIQGSGKETRAYIYIDDFTKGMLKVLDRGKHLEIYNIGTMQEITISQLAKEIGRCFNIKIKLVPGKLTKGSTLRRCPDITKLKKLGFKQKTTLIDGLQKTVDWYNAFAHSQFKND